MVEAGEHELNKLCYFGMTALDGAIHMSNYGGEDWTIASRQEVGEYLRSKGAKCHREAYPATWKHYDVIDYPPERPGRGRGGRGRGRGY